MPRPKKVSTTSNLDYDQILAVLRLKREKIEEAILTIERLARDDKPFASVPTASTSAGMRPAKKPGRQLTDEGRRRLAESMRKRWAAKRKSSGTAKKTAAKKAIKTA